MVVEPAPSKPSVVSGKLDSTEALETSDATAAPVSVAAAAPAIKAASKPLPLSKAEPPVESKKGWGAVRLGGSLLDIEATLSGQTKANDLDSDATELIEGDERQSLSFDALLQEWHRIADEYKKENKINLFTLLTANPPKLVDAGSGLIRMTVENTVQQDLLLVAKPDIVNALRVNLKNYSIDITPVLAASETVRKPYTAQEKYQAMVTKNPLLEQFRVAFNLGLE